MLVEVVYPLSVYSVFSLSRSTLSNNPQTLILPMHWLPVKDGVIYKIVVLGYKIYHSRQPTHFDSLHHESSQVAVKQAIHPLLYSECRCGDACYFKSIPNIFNSLPPYIRDLIIFISSKANLKTRYYLSITSLITGPDEMFEIL